MNIFRTVNNYLLFGALLICPLLTSASNAYQIAVELYPKERSVKGDIQMTFFNHSQDTLQELWVHLWPNAYSNYHTPWAKQMIYLNELDFHYGKSLGRIDSISFTHQSDDLTFILSEDQPDIGVVLLNNPLLPGDTVTIHTPFKVKLPEQRSRMGYQASFYSLAQWFPKFAVYENGSWQAMSYLEQGEFFSDFSDYQVKITLPSAYLLAATDFQYFPVDTSLEQVTYEINTKQKQDFAWFASRKFAFKSEEVTLSSGKKVKVQTYVHTEKIADDIISYASQALKYMSDYLGEYPYDVCTVVEGTAGIGGGMEYPTIATVAGGATLKEQVVHEVVHNWWYGILASNERVQPYLDEGLTSYYENRIVSQIEDQNNRATYSKFAGKMLKYIGLNRLPEDIIGKQVVLNQYRLNEHQASNLRSEEFTKLNYYAMIYSKGAYDFKNLEGYLGITTFDRLMRKFYEENKFRHISLNQLQQFFERETNNDLAWFFQGVVGSTKLSDITIDNVMKEGDSLKISLRNKGKLQVPIELGLVDKSLNVIHSIWASPIDDLYEVKIKNDTHAYAVLADPQWLSPEKNRSNNMYKLSGVKRVRPIQLKFLLAAEDPTRAQMFYTPILAGNKYDGFMLGLALYNRVFPAKKLEYELLPFWGFKSKQFNWIGNLSYHINPQGQSPVDIEIGLHSKSFTKNDRPINLKFIKLQPFITTTFKNLSNQHRLTHQLGYRNIHIWDEGYSVVTADRSFVKVKSNFNTHELWYALENNHALYPTYLKTIVRFDRNYIRQSLELKQKVRYTSNGAYVHFRFFAGAFIFRSPDISFRRNAILGFNISGIDGKNDYLYDGSYFGRNARDGLSSRQIHMGEGDFKVMTIMQNINEGKTVNGLVTANLKMDVPLKWLPVQLFLDLGYSMDKQLNPDNILPLNQFHYDFGFNISLFNEGVEVYFPLLMSSNFKTYYQANLPKFGQRITFSINMDRINFHKRIRNNLNELL